LYEEMVRVAVVIVAMVRLLSVALARVLAQLRLLGMCHLGRRRHYARSDTACEFSRCRVERTRHRRPGLPARTRAGPALSAIAPIALVRRAHRRTTPVALCRQPTTPGFRTGRSAPSEPFRRVPGPVDHALEPSCAPRWPRFPSNLFPVCSPSECRRNLPDLAALQAFSMIGETGFEPATARPPAGRFWLI
jgi:hypothetical protein